MNAHALIAGDGVIGLWLLILGLALLWRQRSFTREIVANHGRGWRTVAYLSLAALLVWIVWVSAFDNWRHLTAAPFAATRQWEYQRVQFDPPGTAVRAITIVLLALALVLCASLVARHLGGYILQLILVVGAVCAWLPVFVIRQRLSLDLAMGFTGSWTSLSDVVAYLGYVLIVWAFDLTLIAVSFLALLSLVVIPVMLLLDLLHQRRPPVTGEAQPFFDAIGGRDAQGKGHQLG